MPRTLQSRTAENLTLAEAVELLHYGACCNKCQEVRRIDLQALMNRFGADFLVERIRPHLICKKCGNRAIIVTTLWRSASTSDRMTEHWK